MKIKSLIRGAAVLLLLLCISGCSMFRPIASSNTDTDMPSITDAPPELVTAETTSGSIPAAVTSSPPETVPVPPTETVVSFVGAGDNIVYYGNVRDAASCALPDGRKYNFAPVYSDVAELIEAADLAFINQETLMCGDGFSFSYYPMFNGPQDLGLDLVDIGIDVVNIANNHMLDKGADGLAATIDFWNAQDGVTMIGGYKNEDDYAQIRVLTVSDIRIAFLSYTFSTNMLTLPTSSGLVVPYPNEEITAAQIARAREEADFVIVSVHWGDENVFTPNEEQRSYAVYLAECGADVIIGHHPHVLQPIEWLERPDGQKTLCVYSLGNFMAEMARDYNMLGGLITFDIVKRGDTVTAENVCFLPTVYYFTTTFYKNHIYYLTDFSKELADSHGLAYYGRSLSLPVLRKYLNDTIADEFLPQQLRADS